MRVLFYLLALVCGVLGTLGVLRSLERLLTGQGVMLVQVAFGLGFLFLAWKAVRKARGTSGSATPSTAAGGGGDRPQSK